MALLSKGLLGYGGLGGLSGPTMPPGLLAQYDPKQMKQQQLKRGLLQAGIAMLQNGRGSTGEVLGNAFAGGLQGAQQAGDDYFQQSLQYQQLADQQAKIAQQQEQEQKVQAYLDTLPPEERALADANPDAYLEQFLQSKFAGGQAKPAGIQEYEYAKAQGFPGTFQDWEASKKGGMSIQMNPDGTFTYQEGSNIKPMTESQSKDTVYATRAEGALKVFDQIEGGMVGTQGAIGQSVGQTPLVGNYMKSGEFQAAEQAGNEFLQAVLRKDTGAAITEGEQALYGNTYLPRPGDGPEVLAQKKASRARAVKAIKAGMTPQAILAQEKALQQGGAFTPPAPEAATPKRFKFNPLTGDFE